VSVIYTVTDLFVKKIKPVLSSSGECVFFIMDISIGYLGCFVVSRIASDFAFAITKLVFFKPKKYHSENFNI